METITAFASSSAVSATRAGLARPTADLAADRVEQCLSLPAGAWARRRLYALRATNGAFASLGVRLDDFLIVEPGPRETPGHLVVTRSLKGIGLQRVPQTHAARGRTATISFGSLASGAGVGRNGPAERTVGTVIGVVRVTANGVPRAVSIAPSRFVAAKGSAPRSATDPLDPRALEAAQRAMDRTLGSWRRWLSRHRELAGLDSNRWREWKRLDAHLATLVECLELSHGPRLAKALIDEARPVMREMHRSAQALTVQEVVSSRGMGAPNFGDLSGSAASSDQDISQTNFMF